MIKQLTDALLLKDRAPYEAIRRTLTVRFGYDGFRQIQRAAFKLLLREAQ